MTKAVMSIETFSKMAKGLPHDISVLIRGNHGIGKSEIVFQLGEYFREKEFGNDNKKLPVIDRRMSQLSEGDIIGLPLLDGKTTTFCPPNWYMQACEEPCILFLDELNRATAEVMQACFQIVLSRELNGWKLHPQTRVYAAINTAANYTVNEMDPALLDRFWVIDLEPTVPEWLAWAKNHPEMVPFITDFIQLNDKYLDPPSDYETGSVTTSRRSWHRLAKTLINAGLHKLPDDPKNVDPALYTYSIGFVGVEAAAALVDYVKTLEGQITAKDIFTKLVKKSGKCKIQDVGEAPGQGPDDCKYNTELLKRIQDMTQERVLSLIEKIVDEVPKMYDASSENEKDRTIDLKARQALAKFISIIPDELRIDLWTKLCTLRTNDTNFMTLIHHACVAHVLKVFNVPLNGSDPNIEVKIPDFLANNNS